MHRTCGSAGEQSCGLNISPHLLGLHPLGDTAGVQVSPIDGTSCSDRKAQPPHDEPTIAKGLEPKERRGLTLPSLVS
jgi:hypothetical protein